MCISIQADIYCGDRFNNCWNYYCFHGFTGPLRYRNFIHILVQTCIPGLCPSCELFPYSTIILIICLCLGCALFQGNCYRLTCVRWFGACALIKLRCKTAVSRADDTSTIRFQQLGPLLSDKVIIFLQIPPSPFVVLFVCVRQSRV